MLQEEWTVVTASLVLKDRKGRFSQVRIRWRELQRGRKCEFIPVLFSWFSMVEWKLMWCSVKQSKLLRK